MIILVKFVWLCWRSCFFCSLGFRWASEESLYCGLMHVAIKFISDFVLLVTRLRCINSWTMGGNIKCIYAVLVFYTHEFLQRRRTETKFVTDETVLRINYDTTVCFFSIKMLPLQDLQAPYKSSVTKLVLWILWNSCTDILEYNRDIFRSQPFATVESWSVRFVLSE